MAGWALGLSLVFCVPLLPLVGVILGIVVLARGSDGRDHGKGLAIAAVVVGSLAMLLQVIGFAGGVIDAIGEGKDGTTRDESGDVVEGGEMLPAKLRVGDCFDDEALRNAGKDQIESGVVQGVYPRVPEVRRHLLRQVRPRGQHLLPHVPVVEAVG